MPYIGWRLTPEEWTRRFMARSRHEPDGCWHWTGSVSANGYGRTAFRRDGGESRTEYAHRLAYELWVGPIPAGHDVDHLCHNADLSCSGGPACAHRACVNPAHLEAVPAAENRRRQRNVIAAMERTHCPHDHAMVEGNIYVRRRKGRPDGRECRACALAHQERVRERRRRESIKHV